MIKLLASLEEVVEAVNLVDRAVSQFIDADTGELLFFAGDEPDGQIRVGEEWLSVERCRINRERFLLIMPIPNTRAFRTIEDWIEQLPAGKPKESFLFAIAQPRPFARFRETLRMHPPQAKQWEKYQLKADTVYVQTWLEENGVIPEDLWDEELHATRRPEKAEFETQVEPDGEPEHGEKKVHKSLDDPTIESESGNDEAN